MLLHYYDLSTNSNYNTDYLETLNHQTSLSPNLHMYALKITLSALSTYNFTSLKCNTEKLESALQIYINFIISLK